MPGESTASAFRADDQRTVPDSELNQAERYNEGKPHSHKPNDSSTVSSNHYLKILSLTFGHRG